MICNGAAFTTMVNCLFATVPLAPRACTVNVKVPLSEGSPLRTPVVALRSNPAGAPSASDQRTPVAPFPLADNVVEYGCPTIPGGRTDAVSIESAGAATVNTIVRVEIGRAHV